LTGSLKAGSSNSESFREQALHPPLADQLRKDLRSPWRETILDGNPMFTGP
jgi:hypothetical protein